MATILQFDRPAEPPKVESIAQSFKALGIATHALARIAETPDAAGERAMVALRDIKQVIVDG
jgi:hypothetical protein